jgi:hypothetical protein
MPRRLIPFLLLVLALPLAGCGPLGGGDSGPAALAAAPPPAPKAAVKLVSKKKLVGRAESMCRRSNAAFRTLQVPAFDINDPLRSLARVTAFAREIVVASHRGYRRFQALGVPKTPLARARWHRFMSQYKATIDHLDEIQAGAEVLDVAFARDSLRQLHKSAESAKRRGHRLGLHACVD